MELQERKPTFKGPADWFTGDVYVDPLAQGQGPSPVSLGWVHFTPAPTRPGTATRSARPCASPRAKASSKPAAEPLIRIRAGDVIVTPPGEWHWHGAAPDHFMAHLAFTEGETEWGDHLTDDEYPSEP